MDQKCAEWGDSNSTSPFSSIRGQGAVGGATCGSDERLVTAPARCCPPFTCRLRTQRGPTGVPVPVPSGRGRLRRSGPSRPGIDRPAWHGKADAHPVDDQSSCTRASLTTPLPWAKLLKSTGLFRQGGQCRSRTGPRRRHRGRGCSWPCTSCRRPAQRAAKSLRRGRWQCRSRSALGRSRQGLGMKSPSVEASTSYSLLCFTEG
jgi:hypothetical protein